MRSVGDSMDGASEVVRLRAENDRLIALLESHGIDWHASQPATLEVREPEPSRLSTAEKVSLFRRLFRGRTDVYPIRWEAKTSGKSGYSPACANEWRTGVCEKPRIKCGDCGNRLLIPLSGAVIYDHLAGEHTVGVYPLLEAIAAISSRSVRWCMLHRVAPCCCGFLRKLADLAHCTASSVLRLVLSLLAGSKPSCLLELAIWPITYKGQVHRLARWSNKLAKPSVQTGNVKSA